MNLIREIPFGKVTIADPGPSVAGTLRAILDKLAAWLDLTPAEVERVGIDTSPGAALLLVPAEVVSPERFQLSRATGRNEDAAFAVFESAPAWISLTIARVPAAEFDAAAAAWRLGGVEALRARWPFTVGR